ncbi:uncharacterized protein OCT59_002132 [Rhizophagus irregularis]|uniref:uncharacterized protein n=1 Tax=Rhizophagus irregularis TaxID=588596 RepID=UPI0019F8C257|nr:hypothetical protein OCT59_002132 [Rhizophagus irregularis]GET66350.1 hypothetical protein GLOIN_2v1475955 [Rhizophagus irregularis DAOM 181602=DAOM 197198]
MCTNTILKRFLLEETDTWGKKDIKEGKKRVIGKQGDRSKAEEEESDEEEWTVSINKKRGGKPGSYGKGRGGRRKHINK